MSSPEQSDSNDSKPLAGIKRPADDGSSEYDTAIKRQAIDSSQNGNGNDDSPENNQDNEEKPVPKPKSIPSTTKPVAQPHMVSNLSLVNSQAKTVIHKIPDKYVGLVIGKKGEQIVSIQSECQCKVQIAQHSNGLPTRDVTIMGNQLQIDRVIQMISEIVDRAETLSGQFEGKQSLPGNHTQIEMPVPGPKVGLVIGKNGETIKRMQEELGVKMVMLQDSNQPTFNEKTLVITGERSRCEQAQEQVEELLASKEAPPFNPSYGNKGGSEKKTYAVPVEKAGLVIGKGGDTVKEIIRLSGAHVEIQREPAPNPNIKIFNVTGTSSQIEHAIKLICDRANLPPPTASYSGYGYPGYQDPMSAAGGMPPPNVNPATGQLDYSAAWAEYYRRQGMPDYASQIMTQYQQPPSGGAPTTGSQQYDYSQWQQYSQQYAQWQQQWAAWQQQQQGGAAPYGSMPSSTS